MRTARLIFALVAVVACYGCGHMNAETRAASTPRALTTAPNSATQPRSLIAAAADPPKDSAIPASVATRVDFPTQIKPILQAKCQPCHFNGGKVYAQMPFDRPETIKTLGTKLFTRIKDENERQLIRDFLAQE
jgi:hypothetical protein